MSKEDFTKDEGKISVSLSIHSEKIVDPNTVSRQLNLSMTHGWGCGDIYMPKYGYLAGKTVIHRTGVWAYKSELLVPSNDIVHHMEYILKIFEEKIDALQIFLNDESYDLILDIQIADMSDSVCFGFENDMLSRVMKICKCIYWTISLGDETPWLGSQN